jgi:hypothetical protein
MFNSLPLLTGYRIRFTHFICRIHGGCPWISLTRHRYAKSRKLICHAVKSLTTFYVTRSFLIVFTTARHWFQSCVRRIKSIFSYPICLIYNSILSYPLFLGLQSDLFFSGLSTKDSKDIAGMFGTRNAVDAGPRWAVQSSVGPTLLWGSSLWVSCAG